MKRFWTGLALILAIATALLLPAQARAHHVIHFGTCTPGAANCFIQYTYWSDGHLYAYWASGGGGGGGIKIESAVEPHVGGAQ